MQTRPKPQQSPVLYEQKEKKQFLWLLQSIYPQTRTEEIS